MSVTAEVTPHHLLLTDDLATSYDPVFKVNPPLRTREDVLALRAGLADGTIDVVATDHAPHPSEDKDCEWNAAAFGMIGLETSLSVVCESMIETGLMDWTTLVNRMSTAPASIGGYSEHGRLEVGATANFIVVNPSAKWTVDKSKVFSRSANTPFHGRTLTSEIVHTFYKGVHVLKNGELTGSKYE